MVNMDIGFEKAVNISTTTPADNMDEVQKIIQLALYGDGVYAKKNAREHTITYRMIDGNIVSEEVTEKSFPLASFDITVQHKTDESVDIIVMVDNGVIGKTKHWLANIF